METTRIFNSADYFQPAEGEPIRSVVTESKDAVVVAWHVKPGQSIRPHIHPSGQDTWTILSGSGRYFLEQDGTSQQIKAGDVVIAPTAALHGVLNNGTVPLVFISVVSPADAGYELMAL
ncbi:MAG: cupin domain-containing protein [Burkholderiaceae bacterium]|nr:MAG: cupin domain-containing protein [Burkholderiaceae bacterium]